MSFSPPCSLLTGTWSSANFSPVIPTSLSALFCSAMLVLTALWGCAALLAPFGLPTAGCAHPVDQLGESQLRRYARIFASAEAADQDGVVALRAPIRWVGPYAALALCFPELATRGQRERGEKGVTLDFVLDTAANTNTINAQVAEELSLEKIGEAAGGLGAGGAIGGGGTFMLGDCELGDLPKDGRSTLMSGLTASALPVASPAAAGLLCIYFLTAFPGGFELRWGPTAADEASITMFAEAQGMEQVVRGLNAAGITRLPDSGLLVLTLTVNGVTIPALLDTGSPITVLNAAAAMAAERMPPAVDKVAGNLLSRLVAGVSGASSGADTLMIAGARGQRVRLTRTTPCELSIGGTEIGGGTCRPYVGELPGLAALNGLGADAGPAAVLGLDVLRQRPRLVYHDSELFL